MAFRRTHLFASSIVVAVSLSAVRTVTHAQQAFTFMPSVSDIEEFTDNAFFTPTHTRSDLITTLAPAINITGQSARLRGTLNYSPIASLYALTPAEDVVGQNLYANGIATVVPNTLFFDARGYMSLVPSTPGLSNGGFGFGPISPGVTPGFGLGNFPGTQGIPKAQLTQTMSFSLSPYLTHRFGEFGTAELRYTLTNTDLSGGTTVLGTALPTSRTMTNEETATFQTGEYFGPLSARLLFDDSRSSGTGVLSGARQQIEEIDSTYPLTPRISLLATIGHENLNYGGTPPTRIDDLIWSGGVQLTPSQNTVISASYSHRNGTDSPVVSIVYSLSPRTTLTATYSSALTTTAQQIANNLAVSNVNSAGQLINQTTLLPQTIVNPALGVQTTLYRTEEFTGGATYSLERNTLNATIYRSDSSVQAQTTPPSSTSQNVSGGTINWAHQISPLATTNLGIGYSQTSFPGLGTAQNEGLLTIGASISYTLTATLSAYAGYNRLDRSSPNPALRVAADLIYAGLSKSF
jgi:uncharacterized protein (PEP-CTERM system associated)